jgi:glyoxylase-like metal-dependent hydrolase (beta-lactamase superfamily II)
MTGQNYSSLIVEQGDRLVMVEAPISAELTRAILDSAAGRFPSKRVAWMVNTHHHWDHASGVRTILASGIPVVTHGRNAEFVRRIGTARKTVKPDALSRGGRLPRIIAVSDSLSLGTGTGQVQVFVTGTTHSQSMVTAYVPAAGVLFQSDFLTASTAGPISRNQAREVLALVQSRGLTVTQVVGGHGELTTMEAIEKAAQ